MSARDIVVIAIMLFTFSIAFFVVHFVFSTITDDMINIPTINETSEVVIAFEGVQETVGRLDYLIFGLFIAFTLALIISGWFIGGIPIFMFIYFIVVVISVVLSTVLANTWETISQASVFGTTITAFPITNNLMLNLPIYISIIGFIGIIVMFAKPMVSEEVG